VKSAGSAVVEVELLSAPAQYRRLIAVDPLVDDASSISTNIVRNAMREAAPKWRLPTDATIADLAATLNRLRVQPRQEAVIASDSETTEPFKYASGSETTGPFRYEQFERINNALKVLAEELPGMTLRAQRALAFRKIRSARGQSLDSSTRPISKADLAVLQSLANLICPTEQDKTGAVQKIVGEFFGRGKPTRTADWHKFALAIAVEVRAAWKQAGRNAVGWGKATSPVVRFVAWALPAVGEAEQSCDAISMAIIRWEKAQSRRAKGDK
jgi:hypothetical protein